MCPQTYTRTCVTQHSAYHLTWQQHQKTHTHTQQLLAIKFKRYKSRFGQQLELRAASFITLEKERSISAEISRIGPVSARDLVKNWLRGRLGLAPVLKITVIAVLTNRGSTLSQMKLFLKNEDIGSLSGCVV